MVKILLVTADDELAVSIQDLLSGTDHDLLTVQIPLFQESPVETLRNESHSSAELVAENVIQATIQMAQSRPHLALIDLSLPGELDAWRLGQELASVWFASPGAELSAGPAGEASSGHRGDAAPSPQHPLLPLIFIAGQDYDPALVRPRFGYDTAAYLLLFRPLRRPELLYAIDRALHQPTLTRPAPAEKCPYPPRMQADGRQPCLILDAIQDGIYVLDQEGRIAFANQRLADMLGYTPQEMLGLPPEVLVGNDNLPVAISRLAGRRNGSADIHENRLFRKDGSHIHVIDSVIPICDASGEYQGVLGSIIDITDRKHMEIVLRQNQIAMEEAQRLADLGSWFFDATATVLPSATSETGSALPLIQPIRWSDNLYRLLGYEPGEIPATHDTLFEHIHPDDRPRARQVMEEAFREGRPYQIEFRLVRKDGQVRHMHAIGLIQLGCMQVEQVPTAIDDSLSPALSRGYYLGILQDVTAIKQAEATLQASEKHFRQLFYALQQGLLVLDQDGIITLANPPVSAILGYKAEELLGKPYTMLLDVGGRPIAQMVLERRRQGHSEIRETIMVHKDGTYRHVIEGTSPLFAADGAFQGVIVSLTDITQRKLSEQTLRENLEKYRSLFEMESDAIFQTDVETLQILEANPAALELYGYDYQEMLTLKATDLSAEPEATAATLREAGDRVYVPLRIHRKKDGTTFPVEIMGRFFTAGGRRRFHAAIRDISHRLQTEQALRQSIERYRGIVEDQTELVVRWGVDGAITFANYAYFRFFNWLSEADVNHPGYIDSTIAPEDRPAHQAHMERLLRLTPRDDPLPPIELLVTRPDGKQHWLQWQDRPIFDAQGNIVEIQSVGREITDRVLAEHELKHSERKYRTLVESLPQAVFTKDLNSVYTSCNVAFARQLNLSPEEVVGKTDFDLYPADMAERHRAEDQHIIVSGATLEVEDKYLRDGQEAWDQIVKTPLYDEDGRVNGILGIFWDITERKRAEQAVKENRDLFDQLTENAHEFFWVVSVAEKKMIYASPALEMYWGIPRHPEYLADPTQWYQRVFEEDRPLVQAAMESEFAAQSSEPRSMEYRLYRADGELRWVQDRSYPIRDEQGRIYRYAGIIEDITERKHMEEALRQSEERYRAIVEDQSELICRWRPDGTITFANLAFCRFLGRPLEDVLGGNLLDFDREILDDLPAHLAHLDRLLSQSSETVPLTPENPLAPPIVKRYHFADGRAVWIQWQDRALFDGRGNLVELQSVGRDITPLMLIEQALQRSNRDLEAFAYTVSHDLHEPLRKIIEFAKLLNKHYHGQLDEKASQWLDIILDGTCRMQRLIDDLLQYSRVSKQEVTFALTSLEEVLEEVLDDLGTTIRRSRAVITHDPLPTLPANVTFLHQLFMNLLSNAVKFHKPGQAPRVQISVEQYPNEWLFKVRDNGIGIPPQDQERIFQVFQRLHPRHEYPGSGLGLAICKKIVERHGGRIWVESQPGEGSTFCFTLPG